MEVFISLATRDDFHDMIQLADVTMPDRMNLHELKKYFELFPDLMFKATVQGRLIGFCCAGIDMYQTTGWLLFSNVSSEYRGLGIGKKFIETRLISLRQFPNLQRVLVTVNDNNTPSIKALEAYGFRWSHTETNYYGPGKDRSILELPIETSLPMAANQPHVALYT